MFIVEALLIIIYTFYVYLCTFYVYFGHILLKKLTKTGFLGFFHFFPVVGKKGVSSVSEITGKKPRFFPYREETCQPCSLYTAITNTTNTLAHTNHVQTNPILVNTNLVNPSSQEFVLNNRNTSS